MYSLDDAKNFVFTHPQLGPCSFGPSVAILFDEETGSILSHGVPSAVRERYELLSAAMKPYGMDHHLVFLEGHRLTPEFLNDMLGTTGKIKLWWRETAEICGFFCAATVH